MAFKNGGSLQGCSPCDCTTYGYRDVYNITHSQIQQYISYANTAGSNHNISPGVFLVFASIETNGDYTASNGGLVQVGQTMLNKYNTYKGTSYTLSDLNATGSIIKNKDGAVALSFDILGQYLENMRTGTGDFLSLLATGWNGCICGLSGSVQCFGPSNTSDPVPTASSCYGVAADTLYRQYLPYCPTDPFTHQPATTKYYGNISPVSPNPLDTYKQVCGGVK